MQFPTPHMEETQREYMLQKIETNLNNLVKSSCQEGLDYILVKKNDKFIKSEFFNNEGKPYIKASTEQIEVIFPVHRYNRNFVEISERIINNQISNTKHKRIHVYNTRNMNNYSTDPISITFTKSIEEWEDTNEFRNEIYQIISYMGKIIEHLYYDTLDLSPEEYPSLIVNTAYMIENNKLMLFGEAKSVLYAFKNNFINELIENIITAVGEFNEDLSAPPPPVRLSIDKFNEILPITIAKKEHTVHTCAICMENVKVRSRICITKCGHCFHSRCLRRWLVNKCQTPECPCCRASLVDTETSEKSENSI